jgi:Short-chain alcohol dehydrogenase of unknown specificity
MFDISKKTIVITGSGRGIGLELATRMFYNGANVIRIDKKLKKIKNLDFIDYEFDLENLKKINSLINKIFNQYKKIDGLINNAGVTYHNSTADNKFNKTLNINLIASYKLIESICPIMKKQKSGSIINIKSPWF